MSRQAFTRIGFVVVAVAVIGWTAKWLMAPSEAELLAEGRTLFLHDWTSDDELAGGGDGLGPVFNASSCVECHFQGGIGGGGGHRNNVTAFQFLPTRKDDKFHAGVVHAKATSTEFQESLANVRHRYPTVPAITRIVNGCQIRIVNFDPVSVERINTPALYGAGLIDAIPASAIKSSRNGRKWSSIADNFNLEFHRPAPGKIQEYGHASVGKFGWRGQFATLEEFVATACAVELGLTNPQRSQDEPHQHRPDNDAELDMTSRQLNALVTYCRNLPRPKQILPTDADELQAVARGEEVFEEVGCAECHQPDIGGIEGVYSDFLLYTLEMNEALNGYSTSRESDFLVAENIPLPDEWQTPPLWGVADSAPYFHDGRASTLEEAIDFHHGQAKRVWERYQQMRPSDQENLIAFLKTLRAPVDAEPVPAR